MSSFPLCICSIGPSPDVAPAVKNAEGPLIIRPTLVNRRVGGGGVAVWRGVRRILAPVAPEIARSVVAFVMAKPVAGADVSGGTEPVGRARERARGLTRREAAGESGAEARTGERDEQSGAPQKRHATPPAAASPSPAGATETVGATVSFASSTKNTVATAAAPAAPMIAAFA